MDKTPANAAAPRALEIIALLAGIVQIGYALASGVWVWLATGAAIVIGTVLQYRRRIRLAAARTPDTDAGR